MTLQGGLSRKEGWRRYVDSPRPAMPEKHKSAALRALSEAAREDYGTRRNKWHRNLPLIETAQVKALHESLGEIVESNPDGDDRIRGVATIDALPALGKSTTANTFARKFDRAEMLSEGRLTEAGHERLPVIRVGLGANNTVKTLSEKMCRFYGHPAVANPRNGVSADRLAAYALDCVLAAETRLAVIDDIHFIDPRRKDGLDVTNHLKYLNSEFPVTFIYVGVQLSDKGFYAEGALGPAASYAQNGRRFTQLELKPFEILTDEGRLEWLSLIKAAERRLVLARAHPGMLTEMADYLFERSTGHIGSLFTLIARGCYRAIRSGEEELTRDLLQKVVIDKAAEKARPELAAGFAAGRLTTRTRGRRTPLPAAATG